MSEETKKALEELARVVEENDIAQDFLMGYKSGATAASGDANAEPEDEKSA